MRRLLGLLFVLIGFALPLSAEARVLHLKFPRLDVPPHSDREACNFVRLPGKKPMDLRGTVIVNKGGSEGFVSHHFLMWAYQGANAAAFPAKSQLQGGEACLDFGPDDREQRVLIAGSQSVKQRQLLPTGLAQRIDPVDEGGKKVIGLILNSHWINSTDQMKHATVKITVYPAKGKVKQYIQPIFDVVANAFIKVPPGERKTSTNPFGWGPGALDAASRYGGGMTLAGGRVPGKDEPICVVMLTAHMHKRGKLFTIDSVDGQTKQDLFSTASYTDPGSKIFDGLNGDPPPMLMKAGQTLHYTCTHDNGSTDPTTQKMGCQEKISEEGLACTSDTACGIRGKCVQGACTNIPGESVVDLILEHRDLAASKFSGAAKRCTTDADCPATDANYPDREFTGKCVAANLVFGFTSDDDMCIMPGAYYDANPNAPAGQECNLDLL